MSSNAFAIPQELESGLARQQTRALVIGAVFGAVTLAGAFANAEQFYRSYLVAFVFWIGIALGCLSIAMLHHLTGGAWGVVIRRPLEAATRSFPLLAVLFLPVLAGIPTLYKWARPEVVKGDHILEHKVAYLNVPFFVGRAALYFAVWLLLSLLLNHWSGKQDRDGGNALAGRLRALSAPGLLAYAATMTFAAVDWMMSLDPHWFSTIYGLLFVSGQAVAAMAFVIAVTVLLAKSSPMAGVIRPIHLHDLGKLLFAFVMLWAYLNFSQFLIVWSANLPEEIPWYIERMKGGWQYLGLALVGLNFALPFIMLLSQGAKKNPRVLVSVACLVVVMRYADLYWLAVPNFHPHGFTIHWLDLTSLIGVGGLWVAAYIRFLKSRPLIPIHDPRLAEALEHGRH